MDQTTVDLQLPLGFPRRRRHFRFHSESPVTIRGANGNGSVAPRGWLRDASPGGLCVELTDEPALSVGDRVEVTWEVPPQMDGTGESNTLTLPGTVVRRTLVPGRLSTFVGIRFLRSVYDERKRSNEGFLHKAVVGSLLTVLAAAICYLKVRNAFFFWYKPLLQIYSIAAASFVLSRVFLSLFYKPPEDRGVLKSVSVIITAKNEEAHIAGTVKHCFQSHYP